MRVDLAAALAYAERHELHALVVERAGDVVLERYGGGSSAGSAHPLYSGTKSFWGVLAVAAEQDGLLALDEPVALTLPEWRDDPRRCKVSLRELLQLTSGIGFGGLGNAVPSYERALAAPIRDEPGTKFTYGGIPLQVFGAVLARKLQGRFVSPHAYLHERILDPLGVRVAEWRTLRDGTQPLPTGAKLTARDWLAFGRFVAANGRHDGRAVISEQLLAKCFIGSASNAHYGLGWWLQPLDEPADLVYASGAGGQALYVSRAEQFVVAHFGKSASWGHPAFLRRLIGRPAPS
jgi:CubicO group peptidase (beta-lactamase class C family)